MVNIPTIRSFHAFHHSRKPAYKSKFPYPWHETLHSPDHSCCTDWGNFGTNCGELRHYCTSNSDGEPAVRCKPDFSWNAVGDSAQQANHRSKCLYVSIRGGCSQ